MGLFSWHKKDNEQRKLDKNIKKQSCVTFLGDAIQPIGKIPANGSCGLSLKPTQRVLNIHHNKVDITLPYERIISFTVQIETSLAKSGSGLGGAILGGTLFGGAGAIVGQNAKKGKTQNKWIGTLTYVDKDGNTQTLSFIERGLTGLYNGATKSCCATNFESVVNNIVSECGEDICDL